MRTQQHQKVMHTLYLQVWAGMIDDSMLRYVFHNNLWICFHPFVNSAISRPYTVTTCSGSKSRLYTMIGVTLRKHSALRRPAKNVLDNF